MCGGVGGGGGGGRALLLLILRPSPHGSACGSNQIVLAVIHNEPHHKVVQEVTHIIFILAMQQQRYQVVNH